MIRKVFLWCGIIAMAWYVVVNIIVPIRDPGYDILSQTVSELSAIDAPTRSLWNLLCLFYTALFFLFGIGVWLSANGNWKLKIAAIVIIIDSIIGLFWPPMHRREIIAAGGGTLTDVLHVTWAFTHLLLMLLMIGFGASSMKRNFRIFSLIIVLVFLVFGFLTARESDGIEAGTPTPHIGLWERINIAAYMLWVVLFSRNLLTASSSRANNIS